MSFKQLYEAAQKINGRVSTRALKTLAIEHSDIVSVREMWSGAMDHEFVRGFYMEGPASKPIPVPSNGCLIGLSRSMCTAPDGEYWRRFVYTKELMHVFDTEDEKASDEASFDKQVSEFSDPTEESTPQFRAENKAVYRALMVLCQEARRKQLRDQFIKDQIIEVISVSLEIPPKFAHLMMQDDFEIIAAHLLND